MTVIIIVTVYLPKVLKRQTQAELQVELEGHADSESSSESSSSFKLNSKPSLATEYNLQVPSRKSARPGCHWQAVDLEPRSVRDYHCTSTVRMEH